jgi:hypothetical protein
MNLSIFKSPNSNLTVAKAIRARVPKEMSLDQLALLLGIALPRLEAIRAGSSLSQVEAKSFAEHCGGMPEDYRDFALQEDAWWKQQPLETQAQLTRLVDEATRGPKRSAEQAGIYAKRAAMLAFAGFAFAALSVPHFLWLRHQHHRLRTDAFLWVGNMYGDRDIAKATMGIEEANLNIRWIAGLSSQVEKTNLPAEKKAIYQQKLLDATHFYMGEAAQYKAHVLQTQAAKKRQATTNIWIDPFTNQPVDVEKPSGGGLDMAKIREMIRLQLRSDYYLPMLRDVVDGKKDPSSIPPLESWGEIALEHQP